MYRLREIALCLAMTALISPAAYGQHQHFFTANYSYWDRWNLFDKGGNITLSNGFLTAANSGGYFLVRASIGVSATDANPKVQWEVTVNSFAFYENLGISNSSASVNGACGSDANGWGYIGCPVLGGTGGLYTNGNGSFPAFGANYTTGDVIDFGLDMTSGTLVVYKNGTLQGTLVTGLTGTIYPTASTYGGNVFNYTANFGATAFTYSIAGYSAGIHH